MRSYYAYCALTDQDPNFEAYIQKFGGTDTAAPKGKKDSELTLQAAIEKGLKEEAKEAATELLLTLAPLEIIDSHLIPALDAVGKGFEKGTVFLPQLLMSADAAKIAFGVLKEHLAASGGSEKKKQKVYKKLNFILQTRGNGVKIQLVQKYLNFWHARY